MKHYASLLHNSHHFLSDRDFIMMNEEQKKVWIYDAVYVKCPPQTKIPSYSAHTSSFPLNVRSLEQTTVLTGRFTQQWKYRIQNFAIFTQTATRKLVFIVSSAWRRVPPWRIWRGGSSRGDGSTPLFTSRTFKFNLRVYSLWIMMWSVCMSKIRKISRKIVALLRPRFGNVKKIDFGFPNIIEKSNIM